MYWYKVLFTGYNNDVVTIELPASKSISNRLLILQFLSSQKFEITNLSKANDTQLLQAILKENTLPQDINCQDAGTVLRFLTCLCAAQHNQTYYLRGFDRLMERPMQPLLDCLNLLGATTKLRIDENENKLIEVIGSSLQGESISIPGNISSQFVSGLCLIASEIKNGLHLKIESPILSEPYIRITLSLLEQFGVKSTFNQNCICIPSQTIKGNNVTVEPDWSSASFFYCLMILSEQLDNILLHGLGPNDIQGDKHIAEICTKFGIETQYSKDGARLVRNNIKNVPSEILLQDYPDLAVPLLIICAFKHPEIRFKGLQHLKQKESNRIKAIQENLEKFCIQLIEDSGNISFKKMEACIVDNTIQIITHTDHRIAMSFTLIAALGYNIQLDNIKCIDKSFPGFFNQIDKLGITLK